ncbi:MAG TPA: hypothetical protein VFS81_27250, partial [Candidatus Binatia bacterium]|nr:hypothetical protein [Candidatus Binatia bacterium]
DFSAADGGTCACSVQVQQPRSKRLRLLLRYLIFIFPPRWDQHKIGHLRDYETGMALSVITLSHS